MKAQEIAKTLDTNLTVSVGVSVFGVNEKGLQFGTVREVKGNKISLGHELIGFEWYEKFYEHYPENFESPKKPKKQPKPQLDLFGALEKL